mgnify:CR=1 FL=1
MNEIHRYDYPGIQEGWDEAHHRRRQRRRPRDSAGRSNLSVAGQSLPASFGQVLGAAAYQELLGARIVRYADDVVILCRRGTEEPMSELRRILDRLGLTLNEGKTPVVDTHTGRFDFYGFSIWMGRSRRTDKPYAHVQPSKRSAQVIKDRVTELTIRNRTGWPMNRIVEEVNTTVRGWVGYVHYRNCSKVLTNVKHHVEMRMKVHLGKRHKGRDLMSALHRYKTRDLYGTYGLYKVPTTAGWTQAHALG